ncbi:structural maintenance of chromosomes protein 3-like [Chelonus insularis]|uniref:structural maintenance of chromosomes protein 3-like n=1 Tax=Chelonus insularis TaxID=460826 RepID=UPI00158C4612|nr:structural maintenance of chromosomes protein 3-like [Chelonus insularis]
MIIKKITLKGYKIFNGGAHLGPFFPGINIIVGENGSGKTHLLEVIEFVFNNKCANLKKEKFNELVPYKTVFYPMINVTIDFDNSEKTYKNLPEKFSIQRLTTSETDHYIYGIPDEFGYVNSEKISREEFVELLRILEMNIFTNLSVLRKDQVIQFATASNNKRLELLLDTISYEECKNDRSDTLVKMRDTKMIKDDECYDKLEKKEQKLTWIEKKFSQLEQKLKDRLENQKKEKQEYAELKCELEKLESELSKNNTNFQFLTNIEKELTETINQLRNHEAALKISIFNSKNNNKEQKRTLEKTNQELESLDEKISLQEKTVESMKSELSLLTANIEKLETKYRQELWELDCLRVKLSKDQSVNEEKKDELIDKIMKDWQESFSKEPGYGKRQRDSLEEGNEEKIELINQISLIKFKLDNLETLRGNNLKELEILQEKIKTARNELKIVAQKKKVSDKSRLHFQKMKIVSLNNTISQYLKQQNILKEQEEERVECRILLKRQLNKRESELKSISSDDDKHKEEDNFVEKLSTRVKELELKLCNADQEEITVEEYRRCKELMISTTDLFKLWKAEEKKAIEFNQKISFKVNAIKKFLKQKNDLKKKIQETTEKEEKENSQIKSQTEDLESTVQKLKKECERRKKQQMEIEEIKKEIKRLTDSKNFKKNEARKLEISINEINYFQSEYNEIRKTFSESQSNPELQVYQELAVINDNLNNIVQKFMPHGHAELIFIINDREYTVDQAKNVNLNDYTGVSIKFTKSKDHSIQNIDELLDEQKTTIALALFLAIQKSSPKPIILCDEIDQVLQCTYRQSLNTILKEMSSKSQIFLTTSKPEILEVGDHFYKINPSACYRKRLNMQQALNVIKNIKLNEKTNEAIKKLEDECYSALTKTIADLAEKKNCPPDLIINPIAIREISQQMPNDKEDMLLIRHVRKNVFAKCGNACLKVTTLYAAKKKKLLEERVQNEIIEVTDTDSD